MEVRLGVSDTFLCLPAYQAGVKHSGLSDCTDASLSSGTSIASVMIIGLPHQNINKNWVSDENNGSFKVNFYHSFSVVSTRFGAEFENQRDKVIKAVLCLDGKLKMKNTVLQTH